MRKYSWHQELELDRACVKLLGLIFRSVAYCTTTVRRGWKTVSTNYTRLNFRQSLIPVTDANCGACHFSTTKFTRLKSTCVMTLNLPKEALNIPSSLPRFTTACIFITPASCTRPMTSTYVSLTSFCLPGNQNFRDHGKMNLEHLQKERIH